VNKIKTLYTGNIPIWRSKNDKLYLQKYKWGITLFFITKDTRGEILAGSPLLSFVWHKDNRQYSFIYWRKLYQYIRTGNISKKSKT